MEYATQAEAMDAIIANLRNSLKSARILIGVSWQWPEWTGVHDNTANALNNLLSDETRIEYLATTDRLLVELGSKSFDGWKEKAYWIGDDIAKQTGYVQENDIIGGISYISSGIGEDLENLKDNPLDIFKLLPPWVLPTMIGIAILLVFLAIAF